MSDVADLLRRAAELIIDRATDADGPAPWSVDPWHADGDNVIAADGEVIARTDHGRAAGIYEAQWIALMHPGIAQPLAAWLRGFAEDMDDGLFPLHLQHACEFARLILGEDG